jgi:methyl-accepting chemotaxis protein
MDEVTQQNAALVEEMASASESMDTQAKALQQLMMFFKVDEHREESHSAAVRISKPQSTSQHNSPRTGHVPAPQAQTTPAIPVSGTNGQQPLEAAPAQGRDGEWEEF